MKSRMSFIQRCALLVLVLAIGLSCGYGLSLGQPPKTIQYRTLTLAFPPAPSLLQAKLEELGAEGWELILAIPQSGTLIFKRS